jgi:hypothetical protein
MPLNVSSYLESDFIGGLFGCDLGQANLTWLTGLVFFREEECIVA